MSISREGGRRRRPVFNKARFRCASLVGAGWGRKLVVMMPKKILVRGPNWIGDHVMAIPLYARLRAYFPDAQIVFLGPNALSELKLSEYFDRTIHFSRSSMKAAGGYLRLACTLRWESFDLAIGLPFSVSSALLLLLSGASRRIAFAERAAGWLLTDVVPWTGRGSGQHKSQLYLQLAHILGIPRDNAALLPPVAKKNQVRVLPQIVLAPGASIELREWPYYPQLAQALQKAIPGFRLVMIGSVGEKKWSKRFRDYGIQCDDRIGQTSLHEVIDLCSKSSLVIANDSGVAHLSGTLARAKTLVIFGPGDPEYVLPIGPQVHPIHVDGLRCRPCESARCYARYGEKACLNTLGVKQVFDCVLELLGAK